MPVRSEWNKRMRNSLQELAFNTRVGRCVFASVGDEQGRQILIVEGTGIFGEKSSSFGPAFCGLDAPIIRILPGEPFVIIPSLMCHGDAFHMCAETVCTYQLSKLGLENQFKFFVELCIYSDAMANGHCSQSFWTRLAIANFHVR
jgi:hypothetical protein